MWSWKRGSGNQFSRSWNFPEMCNFRYRPYASSSRSLLVLQHEIFQWSTHSKSHSKRTASVYCFGMLQFSSHWANMGVRTSSQGTHFQTAGHPGSNPSPGRKIYLVLFIISLACPICEWGGFLEHHHQLNRWAIQASLEKRARSETWKSRHTHCPTHFFTAGPPAKQ